MGGQHPNERRLQMTGFGLYRAVFRVAFAGLLVVSTLITPLFPLNGSVSAGSSDRGLLTIVVTGPRVRDAEVCISLRDLTNNFVVGSYCDNDEVDQDARAGRMVIELPRRAFAVSARATGCQMSRVTPSRFVLTARQTLHVRLGSCSA
jgi:hypothetical protein